MSISSQLNRKFRSEGGWKRMSLKAILIDDEQLAVDFLERQLYKIGQIDVIGKHLNPMVAKDKVLKADVDVIFLDINMPGINGLDLAGQILEEKPHVMIIFVTAYDHYAVDAFDINALDYIVKPIELDRLKRTINRIHLHKQTYAEPPLTNSTLYVQLCGALRIGKTKTDLQTVSWRTAKTQELFLYLLQHRGRLMRKSLLAELLWGHFEEEKAYSQLYTSIYHIRRILRTYEMHFNIKSTMEGYVLNTEYVHIDVEQWETALATLEHVGTETIAMYEQTMGLYTDMYLNVYDYIWAENERHRLAQKWLKTAFDIATYYQKVDNKTKANAWYQNIIEREPDAEAAHFALMKNFAAMQDQISVVTQYAQLNHALEDIGVPVSDHIATWYHTWEEKQLI